jgi:hypothetical protein
LLQADERLVQLPVAQVERVGSERETVGARGCEREPPGCAVCERDVGQLRADAWPGRVEVDVHLCQQAQRAVLERVFQAGVLQPGPQRVQRDPFCLRGQRGRPAGGARRERERALQALGEPWRAQLELRPAGRRVHAEREAVGAHVDVGDGQRHGRRAAAVDERQVCA